MPMLLTLLTALGGSASSAFLHPMVAAASGSMVFLAREVILRLVMCTCAVTADQSSFRSHTSDSGWRSFLRGAVCWLLGVSFTVFLGAMSLQGVTSASIDGVAIRAANMRWTILCRWSAGMFSDTMDTLVGCTLIVKNALGVAAVLVLIGALIGPMIRTLAIVFMLRLSAALLERLRTVYRLRHWRFFADNRAFLYHDALRWNHVFSADCPGTSGGQPDGAAQIRRRTDG